MSNELKSLLPALRRFAYSLTGSLADADDLLQETVVRLLAKPPAPDVPLQRWAFTVCRNLWIDQYRSGRSRQLATDALANEQETATDGERRILDQLHLDEVNLAMGRLPAEQREALALVAVQGMSYREAAQALEVPTGTIMSRLARARSALVRYLQPDCLQPTETTP